MNANSNRSTLVVWSRLVSCLCAVFVYLIEIPPNPLLAGGNGWTKAFNPGMRAAGDATEGPFVLSVWSGFNDHVEGVCSYYNTTGAALKLVGIEADTGDFYPRVALHVSNDRYKWQPIAAKIASGKPKTLTIANGKPPSKRLHVNLDPFVARLREFKFGRIVLPNGETADFELAELSPPIGR